MKMRTIEFKPKSNDELVEGVYKNVKIAFALCSAEQDGAVTQLHNFYYCREAIIGKVPSLFASGTPKLPTRNTWISIQKSLCEKNEKSARKGYVALFEQEIINAVRLVNHFERRNKWLISKAYKTKHEYDKITGIYVIKSSRWWLTSPHTLSLYMLLLRIAAKEQFNNIIKDTTNKEITKRIIAITNDSRDYEKTRAAAMWSVLLDNRRKIFDKGSKENFNIVAAEGAREGILSLTKGDCNDKITYKRFIDLCKEAGVS